MQRNRWIISICFGLILFSLLFSSVSAETVATDFIKSTYVSGLNQPISMAFAPDGRVFIIQKEGAVRVFKNGSLLSTPFHTFTVNSDGERGLLGIAFDPDYSSNRTIYFYHTTNGSPPHNQVVKVLSDNTNPDVIQGGSEQVLLNLGDLSGATNHNGGAIHFGSDGKLYIAQGENANTAYAQSMTNLFGKVLRMNSDGTIPTDNPFYNTASGDNRLIYALGFRNPFTFAVDPTNGRIFINDVGAGAWEEIDELIGGRNYGWPTCEGNCNPANSSYVDPLYAYMHIGDNFPVTGNSISGGAFYRGSAYPPKYYGDYFFADYVGNWVKSIDPHTKVISSFVDGTSGPVDVLVGPDGNVYIVSLNDGNIYKVAYSPGPTPTQSPKDSYVYEGIAYYVYIPPDTTGRVPVYRFRNTLRNVHFYTASEDEKTNTINNLSNRWALEGIAFYVYTSPASDRVPVYRFRDENLGVHFYTASEDEKANTIATLSNRWIYEGVAYYVYIPPDQIGKVPVYRFRHVPTGVHFYTASEDEKDEVYRRTSAFKLQSEKNKIEEE